MKNSHEKYKNAEGKVVPSVTTILNRWKESGGLIMWAWKLGTQGIDLNDARRGAMDAGTAAHDMIDCDVHGEKFDPAPYEKSVLAKAEHAFLGYLEWKSQTKLSVVASEVALVSEANQFGGRFDACLIHNTLRLCDYKCAGGVYLDNLLQVAGGYSLLWQEHFPDKPLDGVDLLRVGKPDSPDDPVSFEHRHWSAEVLPLAQEQFLILRKAYDLDKRLKGLL